MKEMPREAYGGSVEGASGMSDYDSYGYEERKMKKAESPMSAASTADESAPSEDKPSNPDSQNEQEATDESVIIYEADCTISVKYVKDAVLSIEKMVKSRGGFVENRQSSDSYRGAYVTVRIPAKDFDSFLKELEIIGTMDSKEVKATNVSDEYRDLGLRLETAEKIRTRMQELLQRETDYSGRIRILKEIDRITSTIETIKARLQYLKGLADYSTVRISLRAERQDSVRRYIPSPFAWIRSLSADSRSINDKSEAAFTMPEGYFSFEEAFKKGDASFEFGTPGDTVMIRTGSVEHYPKAEFAFWKKAFARDAELRLYTIIESKEIIASNLVFAVYHCKISSGRNYTVAFALSDSKKDIIVLEAIYVSDAAFQAEKEHVENCIRSAGGMQ